MDVDRKEIEEIKTNIAVLNTSLSSLNKSLNSVNTLLTKLDETTSKVYSLDSSIKLLEQKMDSSITDSNFRRREAENSVREIKQQISDMQTASEVSMNEKMERIFSEIKDLRGETRTSFKEVFDDLKEQKFKTEKSLKELEKRVSHLENWRWWIMGVGIAITTILTLVWRSFLG